ncbi:nitroreductase family protein [Methylobacterium nodulans]|uniref:Nitroreductase n=1 Tax=Methylobacterium nodulans (strain LMG 21967 / CNCM I-2342 / ORS 2060) TaxID=460265 RepID=B8IWF4_METNO|nr:nitroreductase family protein [Methylobacterium nodulans]ACL62744.1 nitroreductase [Methylobacterium nodulans ORS 2060]
MSETSYSAARIAAVFRERFGDEVAADPGLNGLAEIHRIAAHHVHRRYADRPVDPALVRLLCACALSAPSKSDLQQRDVVIVSDPDLRRRIAGLLPHMPWVGVAPAFLVVCANGRRLPQISILRDKPFPNDHLDLFFNAVGDAAIALTTCLHAAEAVGLGGCPISEIRNHAAQVSAWLNLPERVIPFAGLCLGWPAGESRISPRLPLAMTLHESRYDEGDLAAGIAAYDERREAILPYPEQRQTARWGVAEAYGWSEDKARQYAEPQRADFGAFVRRSGFNLD